MKELNIAQMEQIDGEGFWGCVGVGLGAVAMGLMLTNPVSMGAFFALYGSFAAMAVGACGS